MLRYSDTVVTVSDAEMRAIRGRYRFLADGQRLTYLQNGGVPDAVMSAASAEPARDGAARGFGLYVGSLTRRKNAKGILHAAVAFLQRYPHMRFVVIGATGTSFEGIGLELPREVADRFEFRGQVNDAASIYQAYRGARFLLFPSFYEASPLPPIEAMTFGCPVVSSRIPSMIERCGDAAVYCDANDQASIAAGIDCLMSDEECWRRHSDRSRVQAAGFTWGEQTRGLVDLCEAVQ